MKTLYALGAFALFHSAHALERGRYSIGSAALAQDQVLTDDSHGLIFSDQQNRVSQIWEFIPKDDGYFEIRNDLGENINCGNDEGSVCFVGDGLQGFLPEFQGGNNYELVAEGSGFFLRVDQSQQLYLGAYDQSTNEQFILTSV